MILIIDDDVAMAENCSMFLEDQGYKVSIASSGAEAIAQINCAPPDLIISDCAMPGMTGLELCAALKANPSTAQLPILLMSGSLRCEVAPASDYEAFLRKPFMGEHLIGKVRQLLSGAHDTNNIYQK